VRLVIPDHALVVLVGVSGAGKSTFAARHFRGTEVLSSDVCRGMVADDESDQAATDDAFAILHDIAAKRLAAGRLTVIDATNVEPRARRPLLAMARLHDVAPVAIVLDLPPALCRARNAARPGRAVALDVLRVQRTMLRRSVGSLAREGFSPVYVLRGAEDIESAVLAREPRSRRA
jgi:protein phosphatase